LGSGPRHQGGAGDRRRRHPLIITKNDALWSPKRVVTFPKTIKQNHRRVEPRFGRSAARLAVSQSTRTTARAAATEEVFQQNQKMKPYLKKAVKW
jgi:hypothetical protein